MDTIIEKIYSIEENTEGLEKAANILKNGGLVAFPTETVYGLGGDGLNKDAASKIYAAKGRPSDNPLIIHIGNKEDVYKLTNNVSKKAKLLMEAFWPGPLTIIFNKSDIVPYETTGGLDTVALRMPSNPVALELIRKSGVYVAAPSANTSGRPSPIYAEHVIEDLSGKIDMIIDDGSENIGIESTIIDVTCDIPTILRPGYITKDMLAEVIGNVAMDRALEEASDKVAPKAPGMKYTHYAPRGELTIVEGSGNNIISDDVISKINELSVAKMELGHKVGIIATWETYDRYVADHIINMGSREDGLNVSIKLYAILREFDALGVEYIYSEGFENEDIGYAIMNRLLKAAGHRVIIV